MLAVRAGDDTLAKGGPAPQGEHDNQLGEFAKQSDLQKQAVDKLKDQLRTLNDKIEEAKRKKNILIARQKRAEAQRAIQDTMRGLSDTSAFDTFERMSQRVDQIEAEAEASTELGGELAGRHPPAEVQGPGVGRRRRRHGPGRAEGQDGPRPGALRGAGALPQGTPEGQEQKGK
jgi:phage shock protein A